MNINLFAILLAFGLSLAAGLARAGFVQSHGHKLSLDGSPFYFLGANAYWLIDAAQSDPGRVDALFQKCNEFDLRVIRTWAFNHKMPASWGVYDETEFRGLDYVVDSAGRHGVKLIMALGNTWGAYRSPLDLMRMAGDNPAGKSLIDFFNSSATAHLYIDHIKTIVTRVNTINDKAYKDDDAIMMWDVINEPRCPGCTDPSSQAILQGWLTRMSAYLKTLAPSQLVAAGTEGYFMDRKGEESNVAWNTGPGALCQGEDWVGLGEISSFDVTTAHVYDREMEATPPSWQDCNWVCYANFVPQYLARHRMLAEGPAINKPFVVEEFNVLLPVYSPVQRAAIFRLFYDQVVASQASGGALAGVMFWSATIGQTIDSSDGYNVFLDAPEAAPPPASPPPPSPASSSSPSFPSSPSTTPESNEILDFMFTKANADCWAAAKTWWLPAWSKDASGVPIAPSAARSNLTDALLLRTRGMSVLGVIRQAAKELRASSTAGSSSSRGGSGGGRR